MVAITGPNTLTPVFRIPQPRNANETAPALPVKTALKGMVRTMTTSVGRQGREPWTRGLKASRFDRGDLETDFDYKDSTCGFGDFKIMFAVANGWSGLRCVSVLPAALVTGKSMV
ncbi:hypothetical protein GCM10022222_51790 [Amycolatopsis ultiminotia]|uniref:Uncharacterized protein n=1 Tax=Amycolatopsis ultiminotia TaxID=543629 RepID=A0ABP6X5B1_9PSEU